MAMTLDDIRNFVRGFPDIDSSDLPNSVLDPIISDQAYNIASAERNWSFYQASYSFNTIAGTQTYSLATLGSAALHDISYIKGPTFVLSPSSHQNATTRYQGPNSSLQTATYPRVWSVWANLLYLWPTPNSVQTHTVVGYRESTDWVAAGAGAMPDLPVEFHMVVAKAALREAFVQQDDFFAADSLDQEVKAETARLRRRFIGGGPAGPVILNGGQQEIGPRAYGPSFPWEQ